MSQPKKLPENFVFQVVKPKSTLKVMIVGKERKLMSYKNYNVLIFIFNKNNSYVCILNIFLHIQKLLFGSNSAPSLFVLLRKYIWILAGIIILWLCVLFSSVFVFFIINFTYHY